MTKKRKKSAHLKIGSLRIPKPMITAVKRALDTPVGKVILAEALVQMATVLVSKHPTAAAAAAGAGAASAGKSLAGSLSDAAVGLMQSTAEALRSGVTIGGKGSPSGKRAKKHHADQRQDSGNGAEAPQGNAIREVLLSEFQKKNRKKKKAAHDH